MDTSASQKSKQGRQELAPKGVTVPPHLTLTDSQKGALEDQPELIKTIVKIANACMKFTGTAIVPIYRPHEGFANLALVTLRIKDGVVEHIEEVSDPYVPIEARMKMDRAQGKIIDSMRMNYPAEFRHA